ncbi:hypothetical protein [Magnetospirillum sp. XM-1]|uniref:hypothetical protein n=1 Tax=Magnetospirillum sp. XM-1 TaxID=1663591 RepID=UPI000B23CD86|nr:hypothetical protein [Magnetospirillum sp. XM-1]
MIEEFNPGRFQRLLDLHHRFMLAPDGAFNAFHAPDSANSDPGGGGEVTLLPPDEGAGCLELSIDGKRHVLVPWRYLLDGERQKYWRGRIARKACKKVNNLALIAKFLALSAKSARICAPLAIP